MPISTRSKVLDEPIGIIGAGVAGLITAHVLLQDGFKHVTLITRDKSVGGTWARERVYPGLYINNIHGEYRFSALAMPPPNNDTGRLSGEDMCNYMEEFSFTFLEGEGKAKFEMEAEVLDISRETEQRNRKSAWRIRVRDENTKAVRELFFAKIVLATGGCSAPKIPKELSPEAASEVGFEGEIFHSSQFASKLQGILDTIPARTNNPDDIILVVGGGKSAHDICAKLTKEGRKTAIVFERSDMILAGASTTPSFIRRSRLPSVLSPHYTLNTRLERFIHTTKIGSGLNRSIWKNAQNKSFEAFKLPPDSPLRRTHSLFWGIRTSDEGVVRPDAFSALVVRGEIEVVSPARVLGYSPDGESVLISKGGEIFERKARVVVLATGYESSWKNIFSERMMQEIGIAKYPRRSESADTPSAETWQNYMTLSGPDVPPLNPENEQWTMSIYRGLVPAKNIMKRDFVIAGGLASANLGYTNEVAAHWISSYFRCDPMRLPSSVSEAMEEGERRSAWLRKRYPATAIWATEGDMTGLDFMTWPQVADELLEDMRLSGIRSGGNWLTWLFKSVESRELGSLFDERRAVRVKNL